MQQKKRGFERIEKRCAQKIGGIVGLISVSYTHLPKNPLELTKGEKELLRTLQTSFKHSDLLHKHVKFLYSHGGIYKCYNSNLLYHGCIPMNEDGTFDSVMAGNAIYSGRSLMDYFNYQVQNAYFMPEGSVEKQWAMDLMWYLWCGSKSPVFGKNKMTTFEHYFIADKSTHKDCLLYTSGKPLAMGEKAFRPYLVTQIVSGSPGAPPVTPEGR